MEITSTELKKFYAIQLPGGEISKQEEVKDDLNIDELEIPNGASLVHYYQVASAKAKVPGREEEIDLWSKPVYIKRYWHGGTIITVDDIENKLHDARTAKKFRENGVECVLRGRFGGLTPIEKGIDETIEVRPEKKTEESNEEE